MKRIPKFVRVSVFFLALGTCVAQIVRAATAPPATAR